ncbi:ribosomal protein S5 domain 2-type protein [Melampsora americana]|nr:ribosomal protein S5 domain 2-type protein [Melampsora americana]
MTNHHRFSLQHQTQPTFDRRRFIGPDSSTPIPSFNFLKTQSEHQDGEEKLRSDGRTNLQFNPIHVKTKVINSANGSCYLETTDCKIICAVYGPKSRSTSNSSSSSNLNIHFKFTTFSLSSSFTSSISTLESNLSQSIHQSLSPSLLPNPTEFYDLHLTVLQSHSPLSITHPILAASIALGSAGVPSLGLVIGISAAISSNLELLIDPTLIESQAALAHLDLSYLISMDSVTHLNFRSHLDFNLSKIDLHQFLTYLDLTRQVTQSIHPIAVEALQNDLSTHSLNQPSI